MSIRLQLRDIFNQDLDKLFSYSTPMLVIIRDRYLGLLAIFINICILLYFIIYVIVMQKAYLIEEYSTGPSIIYAGGTAISQVNNEVRVWDAVDLAYPQYDPSSIVISTQIQETTYQTQGNCTDYSRPCKTDKDCLGSCKQGFCEEPAWCGNSTVVHNLDGVENFVIWIAGEIQFITIKGGLKMSTLDQSKARIFPTSESNSYLLVDILRRGGMNYSDIKLTGAVVRVRINWNCDVTWHDSCGPDIKADRLDGVSGKVLGYRYDRVFYYDNQGVSYRDQWNVTGIKIIVESSGRAYALTIQSIILNVSSVLNLTMITPKIVDFLMLSVMAKRKEYRRAKTVTTDVKNEEKEDNSREEEQPDNTENRP